MLEQTSGEDGAVGLAKVGAIHHDLRPRLLSQTKFSQEAANMEAAGRCWF